MTVQAPVEDPIGDALTAALARWQAEHHPVELRMLLLRVLADLG